MVLELVGDQRQKTLAHRGGEPKTTSRIARTSALNPYGTTRFLKLRRRAALESIFGLREHNHAATPPPHSSAAVAASSEL